MEETNFKRFREILVGMAKVFEREIDAATLDGYWLSLSMWPIQDFEAAAAQLLQTSQFMPRPADFAAIRNAGRPTAGEAWIKALRHASSSAYRKGLLDDEMINNAAAAVGGYGAIAMCTNSSLHFLERRFVEHFTDMRDANDVRQALPQLTREGGRQALEHGDSTDASNVVNIR